MNGNSPSNNSAVTSPTNASTSSTASSAFDAAKFDIANTTWQLKGGEEGKRWVHIFSFRPGGKFQYEYFKSDGNAEVYAGTWRKLDSDIFVSLLGADGNPVGSIQATVENGDLKGTKKQSGYENWNFLMTSDNVPFHITEAMKEEAFWANKDLIFMNAIKNNQPGMVEAALKKGANPNADVYSSSTQKSNESKPLLEAFNYKCFDCVKVLLAAGADPNSREQYEFGKNALVLAIFSKQVELVKLLLNAGAKVDGRRSNDEETPLMYAIDRGEYSAEDEQQYLPIIKILLEAGANVKLTLRSSAL